MWGKAAAWLITFGLLIAVVAAPDQPVSRSGAATARPPRIDRIDFFLNLVAVVLAIWNAFVHKAVMRTPLRCRARFCRR